MAEQPRDYAAKRSFEQTPEPPAEVAGDVDTATAPAGRTFVIHQHHARSLHFDLRLEMFNGPTAVLVSWAVPKNLPIENGVKALAVHVEDHPFEYGGFSGSIPAGNYGAGEVRIFDSGTYELTEQKPGKLTFRLTGRRLKGVWHLVRTGGKGGGKNWLVMLRDWEGDPPEPLPTGPLMLAGATKEVFDDPAWAFEPHLEGLRVRAVCGYRSTYLLSDAGEELTIPGMEKLQERLVALNAVLDGVLAGPEGQHKYVATDLLYLDGRLLTGEPYSRRRQLLEEAVVGGGALGISTSFPGAGAAVLEAALGLGLPGIIAKRLESPYTSGSSDEWVEITA